MTNARPKRAPPKPPATAYTSSAVFKSNSILTRPSCDLLTFLLTCLTSWNDYSPVQKSLIIEALPPKYRVTRLSRPSDAEPEGGQALELERPLGLDFVRTDPYLHEGIEQFRRDIAEGYYDATWRRAAMLAGRDREEGKFATYLREKVEGEFGEVLAEENDGEGVREDGDEEDGSDGGDNSPSKGANPGKGSMKKNRGKGRSGAVITRGDMMSALEIDGHD